MVLPPLQEGSGYLPAGVHVATLEEVEERFGGPSYGRKVVFAGLQYVVGRLRGYGVVQIWVDGSFVTSKQRPRDVEVVYQAPAGADTDSWDMLSFGQRDRLKKYHKVDLWPYPSPQAVPGQLFRLQTIVEYFSTDRDGRAKGVVLLTHDGATQKGADDDQE